MDNLRIYESVRSVPEEAKKNIAGGRLKGMTDINPMWRIKKLTEVFGPCGIGWYTVIKEKRLEVGANGEIAAFMDIELYVKIDGEWSKPIPGTGGSMLVEKERNGLYTNDECFKMAYTDALSVACKALGFGADVYWDKDKSKYDKPEKIAKPDAGSEKDSKVERYVCVDCGKPFEPFELKGKRFSAEVAFKAAIKKCGDGQARCKDCRIKAGYEA